MASSIASCLLSTRGGVASSSAAATRPATIHRRRSHQNAAAASIISNVPSSSSSSRLASVVVRAEPLGSKGVRSRESLGISELEKQTAWIGAEREKRIEPSLSFYLFFFFFVAVIDLLLTLLFSLSRSFLPPASLPPKTNKKQRPSSPLTKVQPKSSAFSRGTGWNC